MTRVVTDSMFVYHFIDLDLRVEIYFEKEGAAENGIIDFEIGDIGTSTELYWNLKKISCRACLLFINFWVTKKQLLTALLTCTFIRSFLKSFNLPSYSSEWRKSYTLRPAVDVSKNSGVKGFPVFLGKSGREFVRNCCL